VGVAAETQDVVSYARDKLQRKKLDLIVANDVSDSRIGFNTDDNRVTVIGADAEQHIEQMSKRQLARQLIAQVLAEAAREALMTKGRQVLDSAADNLDQKVKGLLEKLSN